MSWWNELWGLNQDWEWDWDPSFIAAFVVALLFALAVAFLIEFFFLRNLRDLLRRVEPYNRAMPPGRVWLNFIPLFGLGWMIYTVIKVRDSLKAEFRTRGWLSEGDFGYRVGMTSAVLAVVSWALNWIPRTSVSVLGSLIGVGGLVCWIIYWVKMAGIKSRLGTHLVPPGQGYRPYPDSDHREDPEAYDEEGERAGRCGACGFEYDPGDRYCRRCGRPLR